MAWCDKGHKYNEGTHSTCPICVEMGVKADAGAPPSTVFEDDAAIPAARPSGARERPAKAPRPQNVARAAGPKTQIETDEVRAERLMGFLALVSGRDDDEHVYHRLHQGVNWIGRFGSDAMRSAAGPLRDPIELRDRLCSDQHAIVICTNNTTRLVDLDSSNGTKVNGNTLEIAVLEDGDTISIGRAELVYVPFGYVAED